MSSQSIARSPNDFVYTSSSGAPISQPYAFGRVGDSGPLLLEDAAAIEVLAHFARERIPERVVHARGAGAHGYFEVTHDITDLTCASIFSKVGNRAPATVRISLVGPESGSADTLRDTRGFAIKIKTEEGVLDWVFNDTPVFFVRDPLKFTALNHTQKRDPRTHLRDADMVWDFFSQNPETVHQVLIGHSDRGTPNGYHHVHAYSGHTYKFINAQGSFTYVRIQLRNDRGFKTLTAAEAQRLAGENPDYGIQSMFEDIDKGDFPSWTVYVQTMTLDEAEKFRFNILDMTKVWPHAEYPQRPIGRLVLDRNPQNYFAEVEQVAFSPSNMVRGIGPSADPMLQARIFAYPDAARYRLGVNHNQLPVNAPLNPVANFQRDGFMAIHNQGARPNYASSIAPLRYLRAEKTARETAHEVFLGRALAYLSEVTQLDFEQPRMLWQKVFDDTARDHLVSNVAESLKRVKSTEVRDRQLSVFALVDQTLSDRIADSIDAPHVQPLKVKAASEVARPVYSVDVDEHTHC